MKTTPQLEDIEDWLIREALGQPDIGQMFVDMCERMLAAGVPVERAMLSWTTLHPLIEAETAVWLPGAPPERAQHGHDDQDTEDWLASPIRAMLVARETRLRRRLTTGNASDIFPVLARLRREGFTDYLIVATPFHLPSVNEFGTSGIIVSWATRATHGFSDAAIEQIDYLQMRLALAARANIQSRIATTLAETYLGRRAGAQVLSGRIRHGDGEAIDAVIFYSDLRGSTALADRLPPDAYLAHLNAYFDAAAGAVMAQDGEVLDFIGDAVLAVFPIGTEGIAGAARRALTAAEVVRHRLAARQPHTPHPLTCGIALSAGEVTFGNIGVADRLTFSVIGRTVNAAARIEGMTKRLTRPVLVTQEIAQAVPEVAFDALGRFALDGFDAPVALYAPRADS
ncbi:adenylate/guanylate cyclase domain-containing protein [Stappia sp.]|uniref:adenylate/guanylate cyclase domain-containing protein n=1 Tax=Stappia sp. TaxID=1870903 RepID=UPI0032D958D1